MRLIDRSLVYKWEVTVLRTLRHRPKPFAADHGLVRQQTQIRLNEAMRNVCRPSSTKLTICMQPIPQRSVYIASKVHCTHTDCGQGALCVTGRYGAKLRSEEPLSAGKP